MSNNKVKGQGSTCATKWDSKTFTKCQSTSNAATNVGIIWKQGKPKILVMNSTTLPNQLQTSGRKRTIFSSNKQQTL